MTVRTVLLRSRRFGPILQFTLFLALGSLCVCLWIQHRNDRYFGDIGVEPQVEPWHPVVPLIPLDRRAGTQPVDLKPHEPEYKLPFWSARITSDGRYQVLIRRQVRLSFLCEQPTRFTFDPAHSRITLFAAAYPAADRSRCQFGRDAWVTLPGVTPNTSVVSESGAVIELLADCRKKRSTEDIRAVCNGDDDPAETPEATLAAGDARNPRLPPGFRSGTWSLRRASPDQKSVTILVGYGGCQRFVRTRLVEEPTRVIITSILEVTRSESPCRGWSGREVTVNLKNTLGPRSVIHSHSDSPVLPDDLEALIADNNTPDD